MNTLTHFVIVSNTTSELKAAAAYKKWVVDGVRVHLPLPRAQRSHRQMCASSEPKSRLSKCQGADRTYDSLGQVPILPCIL